MQAKPVPATPSVIAWAIQESGYSVQALATLLEVPEEEIEAWTHGKQPNLAELQALAAKLQRPFSAFFLPGPPASSVPAVKFRSSMTARRQLNPEERRRIREAARLQHVASWITRQLQMPVPELLASSTKSDVDDVAKSIRARLHVSLETQLSWSSATEALRTWREAVEALGILVLMLPMGEESCRGFSIWDDAAPLIAINTAWLPEARVFTLFHELAHLVTRTNSACAEDSSWQAAGAGDRVERWCERVAAAVVVPADALSTVLSEKPKDQAGRTADLSTAGRIATRFRVSRRAAALRLIECKQATWGLFKSIPPHTERLSSGGGGMGRTRAAVRRQRYGQRTMALFREAIRQDVIGPADVVDYLDVTPDALTSSLTLPSRAEDE